MQEFRVSEDNRSDAKEESVVKENCGGTEEERKFLQKGQWIG